ncbi:MAG TPA: NAD-dependent epimerase/dehydratase family protein [Polyangiaceae bacterium]
MSSPRRILVTGAAGFIASNTTDALLARGDQVVGIDNLNDYYDPARKRANLAEVRALARDSARFEFRELDIRDRAALRELVASGFDAIVHLAAMAGVRASVDNPWLYYDVNLTGTLNLLDAAREYGKPNFVFASTSSAYGATNVIPFIETDPSDRPLAAYAASKRAAEMLGFSYHHLHGLDFTALRFFTVYGPRGRPDMMAFKVLDSVRLGREVPLYNNGQMHRDWTYVSDIVQGVVQAADRRLGYEVINLGRGEPVLLADFVQALEELAGKKAKLVPAPMMDADVAYTYADIGKAQRLLGYAPEVSVRDGVRRFWEWYTTAVGPL